MASTNYHFIRPELGSAENKIPNDPLTEWEVERIIDSWEINGETEYQVVWKATWGPYEVATEPYL